MSWQVPAQGGGGAASSASGPPSLAPTPPTLGNTPGSQQQQQQPPPQTQQGGPRRPISFVNNQNQPITASFKHHILTVTDSKTGAMKTFRLAAATSPPWLFSSERQDYSPEMLQWDMMLQGTNAPPEMAPPCQFNFSEYDNQLEESSTRTAFADGSLRCFKYHTHFVEDAKVGEKRFYVANITSLPRLHGHVEQHYTPEMHRWDEMCLENNTVQPLDTMAVLCQVPLDEIEASAERAQELDHNALFKYHLHEVQDQRVGLKRFYVHAMTCPPEQHGREDQHFTPEMLHWDMLRRDAVELRDGLDTMAQMCGTNLSAFK